MSIQFGPEWRDFSNRLSRYPQVTEANLRRTLNASLVMIERDARRGTPQDTRRLMNSMTHEITGSYPNLVGRVGPSVTYGIVMEFGRRARRRQPPVDALIPWVRRHWRPGVVGPMPRGQLRPRRTAGRNVSESEIRSRAFALARAIGERGIQARPYLRPAYQRNRAAIEALFARIGVRITSYLAGGPSL